ncbi:MAG TPA: N-acetyltransferase [Chitinophagaceae bacterium]|nr:N-acetyltransferase [Chitinophagaceae bacterium]
MPIHIATEKDIPALVALINSAYRGDGSKQGWTTEADIIAGDYRILPSEMEVLMKRPGVVFLKSENEEQKIEGTVFLEKRGEQLYLGMLSVAPGLQGKGTGHQLVLAAEEHAKQQGCCSVIMRVIHLRNELIAWYERRGYYNTGRIENYSPSSYETIVIPFHFVILQKDL